MIQPEVTVAAVIEHEGRYLMVEEQVDGHAVFNQPAGHLEPGESFAAAIMRETREETGQQLRAEGLVGIYFWPVPDSGTRIMRLCFFGSIERRDDPRVVTDADVIATHWLDAPTIEQSAARLRSPLVLRAIHDYQAGRRFPLTVAQTLDAQGVLL